MNQCRNCGSDDLIPYETQPPHRHKDKEKCTEACISKGFLCLNCRLFRPEPRRRA
jgi:hypothetical protein